MTEENLTYLEIKILGKVQGVGFRYFVKRQANKFNIKGFCRNEIDGSVFVNSSGKKENQKKLLCKRQLFYYLRLKLKSRIYIMILPT